MKTVEHVLYILFILFLSARMMHVSGDRIDLAILLISLALFSHYTEANGFLEPSFFNTPAYNNFIRWGFLGIAVIAFASEVV